MKKNQYFNSVYNYCKELRNFISIFSQRFLEIELHAVHKSPDPVSWNLNKFKIIFKIICILKSKYPL